MERFFKILEDRCRLSGILGQGVVKLRLDVVVFVIIISICLFFVILGLVMIVFMLFIMFVFLLWFYRLWKRNTKRERILFFYFWGLMSVVIIFVVFEFCVVGFREIFLWEYLLFLIVMFFMFYNFVRIKLNVLYLKFSKRQKNFEKLIQSDRRVVYIDENVKVSLEEMIVEDLLEFDVKWVDFRLILGVLN